MNVELKTFDREGMARWYAERHLTTDDAIREIHYLPAGSPPNEIRFVEVNEFVSESPLMEPVDFGVDVDGTDPHSLIVLDVTPKQWDEIRAGKLNLPAGWTLQNSSSFSR